MDDIEVEGRKIADILHAVARVLEPQLQQAKTPRETDSVKMHHLVALRLMTERVLAQLPAEQRVSIEGCVLLMHEQIYGQKLVSIGKDPVTGRPGR